MDAYEDIAPFYDCEHEDFVEDIDFYLNIVRQGPVLEIGAGTGRVTAPLARANFEIWAVEPSAAMLDRASVRLAGLEHVHLTSSSVLELEVPLQARTALLPLNTLWHFTSLEEQLQALKVVRRYCRTGALLVIDLANPHAMADRAGGGELRQRLRRRCNGRLVTIWSAAWDDEAEQILELSLTYDAMDAEGHSQHSTASLRLRYIYRSELDLLLRLAGFAVRQVYGSYDLDPYRSDSSRLICVGEAV